MTKLTYSSYLNLDRLLTSQHLLSLDHHPFAHDELLFIITHQSFELWFRQTIHEFDRLQQAFRQNQPGIILDTLKRVLTILDLCNHQFQVLETMSPTAFATFRNQFGNASGFQSIQFREIEFAMGMKRSTLIDKIAPDEFGRSQLIKRYEAPTVWDAFLAYLHEMTYAVPTHQLQRDVTEPIQTSAEIQTILHHIYYEDPMTRHICERLLDLDKVVQTWRQQHLLLAERLLGDQPGTHGMSLSYLRRTIRPHFPDLWKVRQQFIQTEPTSLK
ncbi:MAG: tryptophan 2,3-dioxygenase [Anaerolineae bacterium]|nr:tryptophan 2,3-dioxygenase [Anaerolineae bacterium]